MRLLFVGDSFTEGYGVNDGEEFPRLIARWFAAQGLEAGVHVVNAGIGDTGTGRALRFLKQYPWQENSQTVLIYQLSPNDFEDNLREGFYSLDATGRLHERVSDFPKPLSRRLQPLIEAIPLMSRSHFVAALLQLLRGRGAVRPMQDSRPPSRDMGESDALTFRLLEEIVELADSRRWPLIGIVFGLDSERQERVRQLYDRLGVTTVLVPDKASNPRLYFERDDHWNREGHKHVTQALLPVIPSPRSAPGR
jgi:hypothetical protein